MEQEKDLGAIISCNVKSSDQRTAASKKKSDYGVRFNFKDFSSETTRCNENTLYTICETTQHLEYAFQFWSPNRTKDQNLTAGSTGTSDERDRCVA
jgi:hypothetical protein